MKNWVFIFVLLNAVGAGFCGQKAQVITVTGKNWAVVFLRMHNDTIYLQVPKINGKKFSVSGHKSKFKSVEFADGTFLDLSLSNYPAEPEIKSNADIGEFPGSTFNSSEHQPVAAPSSEPNAMKQSTFSEDSLALNAAASPAQKGTWSDSLAEKEYPSNNIGQANVLEKSDSTGGTIVIESKPSIASITLDGRPLQVTTPYTIKHLAPGRHGIRLTKDSLNAFTLVTVKEHKIISVSVRLKKEVVPKTPPVAQKKGHGLAWSLSLSSVALFACGAVSYYFALADQNKAQDAKNFLDESLVPGNAYEENLAKNKQKSDAARKEVGISEILAGVGILDLGLGVVFFF
jgi:PEGA domain